MKKQIHRSLVILFITIAAMAAFGVYYNALSNGFIWDDPIVLKRQVSAFRTTKDIFFPPVGIPQFGLHYYRPLVMLSYIIDKAIWGTSPFGFHFSVILLHILNTILVFFLSRFILKEFKHRDIGALIASLVFAVHPIHTESVAWMAGRSDVMAAFFFFLSLFFYLKFKEETKVYWLALSSILFLFAGLAKETSLAMILLLPFIDISLFAEEKPLGRLARHELRKKKRVKKKKKKKIKEELPTKWEGMKYWTRSINIFSYIPFIFATVIYFIVRSYALRGGGKKVLQTLDYLEIPKIITNSYGFYIAKVFLPINLKAFIAEVPLGFWATIFSIMVLMVLFGGIIFSFAKKNKVVLFSIIFFILTFVPSILVAIMKISETPLAERYLYIPSLSFSLIIGYVFLYIPTKLQKSAKAVKLSQLIILSIVAIILAAFSIQTVKRNTVWRDDLFFWEDLVKKVPDQGLPHLNLGLAYSENERPDDAEREYIKAIESKYDNEGRSLAYNNLGNIYLARGEYDRAEQCFSTSISIRKRYATPYYSMALSKWRRCMNAVKEGQRPRIELMESAMDYLNDAISINPQYIKAHALLGDILIKFRRYDEAKEHLNTVLLYEKEGRSAEMAKKLLSRIPEE